METLKKRFISAENNLRAFASCGCGMPSCGCGSNINKEQSTANSMYTKAIEAQKKLYA